MILEQAIASYEKSAERYHKAFLYCKAHGGEFYQSEAESNRICEEHERQLVAWLRELQERRKEPEVTYCKNCVNRTRCTQRIKVYTLTGTDTARVTFCSRGKRPERRTE